jgi:drug/metabolite transporter (DMT)-like permease
LPALTPEVLFYGAWVGLVEMGITFLLWQQALRLTTQAARIGQLIFLSPFLSLLLIGAVLGEHVHTTSWLGLGIIVVGLLVTGRPQPATSDAEPDKPGQAPSRRSAAWK